MKIIKVLGPGCKKCKMLSQNVKDAVSGLPGEFDVQKIEDMEAMMKYNMMSSPGLVIDEKLIMTGKVATVDELRDLLRS